MKLAPRLDGATIRHEVAFAPTSAEWEALSATCPGSLLEGDRDELARIGLTYLELCATQEAALTASDVKVRLAKVAKALAALQATLAYPQDLGGFDIASQTETLLDIALEERVAGFDIEGLVATLTATAEATTRVVADLDAIPQPEGQGEAKGWLYGALFEFFELKPWPTSHRCDNVPPEAAPPFTRFVGKFLHLAGQRGQHFVMASLGKDIARSKAARTRTGL